MILKWMTCLQSGCTVLQNQEADIRSQSWSKSSDLDMCYMMLIMHSHQQADSVRAIFSESDPSGMLFGEAVCHQSFFLSPRVAADGAPLPGDTDRNIET